MRYHSYFTLCFTNTSEYVKTVLPYLGVIEASGSSINIKSEIPSLSRIIHGKKQDINVFSPEERSLKFTSNLLFHFINLV